MLNIQIANILLMQNNATYKQKSVKIKKQSSRINHNSNFDKLTCIQETWHWWAYKWSTYLHRFGISVRVFRISFGKLAHLYTEAWMQHFCKPTPWLTALKVVNLDTCYHRLHVKFFILNLQCIKAYCSQYGTRHTPTWKQMYRNIYNVNTL